MIFSDFLGIIILSPVAVFIILYGVIALYRIFDYDI